MYYSPRIVTSGLVFAADAANRNSYVSGSKYFKDLSGNTITGSSSIVGAVTFSNTNGGVLNTGAYNSGKYFNFGIGLSQVNFTTQNFTIMIMFVPNSGNFGGGQIGLFGYGRTFTVGYYMMLGKTATNKLSFFTNGTGGGSNQQETRSSDFSVYSGKWTLLTITRTGSSVKIYANLKDITETAGTHSNPASNTLYPLVLAAATENGSIGNLFDGKFASFIIYNRDLSTTEIQQNYLAIKARFGL